MRCDLIGLFVPFPHGEQKTGNFTGDTNDGYKAYKNDLIIAVKRAG